METDREPWLEQMQTLVCAQHELVPFLRDLHAPADMQFQPLPAAMLAQLQTSPDWRPPDASLPTVMMLETEEASGGLLIVRASNGRLFVLVPA